MKPSWRREFRRLTPPGHFGLWFLLLVLTSCRQVPVKVQDTIKLPPLFSDNMVLQQGTRNIIWGSCAPGQQVWVRFKNVTGTTRANHSGRWQLELDLTKPMTPSPDRLCIGVGKVDQQPLCVLTNVAAGNVWLLGVLNDKGVPVRDPGKSRWIPNLRVITITNINSADAASGESSAWHPCTSDYINSGQLSALSFYFAYGLSTSDTKIAIGIIQTGTNGLAAGLKPARELKPARLARLLEARGSPDYYARQSANDEVVSAQNEQRDRLNEAKHMGLVTDIPPVIPYGDLTMHLSDEFDPAKPPASLINFEGAIW